MYLKMSIILLFVAVPLISATQYIVGNREGWNPDAGTNYTAWAEKHSFRVGDSLKFMSFRHHVIYKVNAENYAICNGFNALATYTQGSSKVAYVNLDHAGEWYFVDKSRGKCDARVKMHMSVYPQGPTPLETLNMISLINLTTRSRLYEEDTSSIQSWGEAEWEAPFHNEFALASSPANPHPSFQRSRSARLVPTLLLIVALAFPIALMS